jgi:Cactus-binding C-terminus of cactin protein/Conserved mid region of cactin
MGDHRHADRSDDRRQVDDNGRNDGRMRDGDRRKDYSGHRSLRDVDYRRRETDDDDIKRQGDDERRRDNDRRYCGKNESGRRQDDAEDERRECKRRKRAGNILKLPRTEIASVPVELSARKREEEEEEEEEEEQFGRRDTKKKMGGIDGDDETPFVWAKKETMLKRKGVSRSAADESGRRAAAIKELEEAKKRREVRNRERDEADAKRAREARVREQELNEGWDRKEESFHGQQHFLRQAIRLGEGRSTLADTLARNVRLDMLELQPDPRSPCAVLDSMLSDITRPSLVQLDQSIQLELDYIPDFSRADDTDVWNRSLRFEWWSCLDVYVKDALSWCSGGGVHSTVQRDLEEMLAGKSHDELVAMEVDIAPRVRDGGEVDFWQAALGRIRRAIAAARIEELNSVLATERGAMLAAMPADEGVDGLDAGRKGEEDLVEGHVTKDEEAMVRAEAAKGMKRDEEDFADVVQNPRTVAAWRTRGDDAVYAFNDKYRPRRPRFFNRVHSGYDWNKYNRTHYDHDNPPPKTVQGYKFNIFYPDLIDRSVAPTFSVAHTDNPDVCILTFHAGPPYEDLAFKIMSRPWEHSHRRGFRCSFDRSILHLWFNFQRLRYRR